MAKRKKPSDEPTEENQEPVNDADNFGLPDIDYKPLEHSAEADQRPAEVVSSTPVEPVAQESRYGGSGDSGKTPTYSYMEEEENKSKAPVIIGVSVLVVVLVAGFLIYQYVYKPNQEAKAAKELAMQRERDQAIKDRQEREAREAEEARRRQAQLDSLNAVPKVGTIETLTDRTRRYYVVVSSGVDGDLVMDYAKKLSVKGVSTKIIPPFGKYKFSRLAIGDYDTFASAQTNADAAKADYGGEVWVLKF
jgi:hypothetical protein